MSIGNLGISGNSQEGFTAAPPMPRLKPMPANENPQNIVQGDVQGNLPRPPNNGNPGGANNFSTPYGTGATPQRWNNSGFPSRSPYFDPDRHRQNMQGNQGGLPSGQGNFEGLNNYASNMGQQDFMRFLLGQSRGGFDQSTMSRQGFNQSRNPYDFFRGDSNYFGGQSQGAGRYIPPMMNNGNQYDWMGGGGYNYNLPNAFGSYPGYGQGNPYSQSQGSGYGSMFSPYPQQPIGPQPPTPNFGHNRFGGGG